MGINSALCDALSTSRTMGVTTPVIRQRAVSLFHGDFLCNEDRERWIRARFQKSACLYLIPRLYPLHSENFLYGKLNRWRGVAGMPERPAANARRCLKNISQLKGLVLPRVQQAVLSTICNRWCTARRFQQATEPCKLGCSTGEDSLEHYCICSRTVLFATSNLGLSTDEARGIGRWTFCVDDLSPSLLVRTSVLLYCAYSAVN